jgi:hypothetical protein
MSGNKTSNKQNKIIVDDSNLDKLYTKITMIILNSKTKEDAIAKLCKVTYKDKNQIKQKLNKKSALSFYKVYTSNNK